MSRRNVMWLAVIVVAGVAVGAAAGWAWGLLAAGVVLVVSEVFERARRERIRRARGDDGSRTGVRDVVSSRRRR